MTPYILEIEAKPITGVAANKGIKCQKCPQFSKTACVEGYCWHYSFPASRKQKRAKEKRQVLNIWIGQAIPSGQISQYHFRFACNLKEKKKKNNKRNEKNEMVILREEWTSWTYFHEISFYKKRKKKVTDS